MPTTHYFTHDVLVKRPYLTEAMCVAVIENAFRSEVQPDGRIRWYGYSEALGKWLRVITLADGETIHNAFPDRGFVP